MLNLTNAWETAAKKGNDGMVPFVKSFLLPILTGIIALYIVLTLVDVAKEYNGGNANAFKENIVKIVILLIIGAAVAGATAWMWIVI